MQNDPKPANPLTEKERKLVRDIIYRRQKIIDKYPLPFALLVTFGLVATFYGFEGLIDKVQVLEDNPIIMLFVGLSALTVTGTLYQKLK